MVTFLAVYVDDILMIGNDEAEMNQLIQFLHQEFRIKDLGELHYFLGIEAVHEEGNIILTQRNFTMDLLDELNCQKFTPVLSPLINGVKLTPNTGQPLANPIVYRRLIG